MKVLSCRRKLAFYVNVERHVGLSVQESCAIAKTTARCALYIAALKTLESP